MKKEDYNNLNNTINCFDGRGKGVYIYKCDICGSEIHTQYKDKGITIPLECRKQGCRGTMWYTAKVPESTAIICDWYRPSYRFYRNAGEWRQHLDNGGLFLDEKPLREAGVECSIVK